MIHNALAAISRGAIRYVGGTRGPATSTVNEQLPMKKVSIDNGHSRLLVPTYRHNKWYGVRTLISGGVD